jgi:TatD DNase family protein
MTDTHCHIYLKEFDADRAEMILRGKTAGVNRFLLPAIDSETHISMLRLENEFPRECFTMMGLHPCSVKEGYEEELKIARQYLENRKFIAIGEIGLDFYWDLSFKEQQLEVFNLQMDWALEFDLPIVIHSRESIDECIEAVGKKQNGKLKGVFHCFGGSAEQANKIIDLGFYLGIGGVVTFKKSGLDTVLKHIDIKHILLETDAPYLAPVPYRGKRNECSYLKLVAEKIAEIKNVSLAEVDSITTNNAETLFGT